MCWWYRIDCADGYVQGLLLVSVSTIDKGAGRVEYRRRVVDNELDELMPGVAAIAIVGARAVGTAETASARDD